MPQDSSQSTSSSEGSRSAGSFSGKARKPGAHRGWQTSRASSRLPAVAKGCDRHARRHAYLVEVDGGRQGCGRHARRRTGVEGRGRLGGRRFCIGPRQRLGGRGHVEARPSLRGRGHVRARPGGRGARGHLGQLARQAAGAGLSRGALLLGVVGGQGAALRLAADTAMIILEQAVRRRGGPRGRRRPAGVGVRAPTGRGARSTSRTRTACRSSAARSPPGRRPPRREAGAKVAALEQTVRRRGGPRGRRGPAGAGIRAPTGRGARSTSQTRAACRSSAV